jgi:hypothetical protein
MVRAIPMIIGIYIILGMFLIIASKNPVAHTSLIWFTVWSSVVHAGIMAVQVLTVLRQSHRMSALRLAGLIRLHNHPDFPRNYPESCSSREPKRAKGDDVRSANL